MITSIATKQPQQRSVETRDRLVDAAVREFAEKGFDGASTRAIATRANVAQSAMPYHFTTKQTLWQAAADKIFGAFHAEFASKVEALEEKDPVSRVRLLLSDFVRFAANHPELHRFMLQEGTILSPRLKWLVKHHVSPAVAFLKQEFAGLEAAGWQAPGSIEHMFYMLIGAASTPYALAPEFKLTMKKDPFADEMVEAHVESLLRLFFGDANNRGAKQPQPQRRATKARGRGVSK